MFKRNKSTRGALLAGAFLVSMAIGLSMLGLMSFSKTANHQAASLISKSHLSLMAQERFTTDLLTLNNNIDLTHFSTTPAHFPWGDAESFVSPTPPGLAKFGSSLYLVVIATLTKNNMPGPHHIRLETLIGHTSTMAAPLPPPEGKRVLIADLVEDQLRAFIPADDPQFESVKRQILDQLRAEIGVDLDSLMIPTDSAQYRDPTIAQSVPATETEKEGAFYMSPLSLDASRAGARVLVWKEVYY